MPGGYAVLNSHYALTPVNWTDLVPANANCSTGIQWIWAFMGQCVVDARGMAAVVCGFICLTVWIMNGIPQMVENCRVGLPDQAISPFLLLFWILGDTSNLIGCLLTHQLVLQAVISVYSIASDLVLITQFMYYKVKHQVQLSHLNQQLINSPIILDTAEEDSLSPQIADEYSPSDNQWSHQSHLSTNLDADGTRLLSLLPFVGITVFLTLSHSMTGQQKITANLVHMQHLLTWSKSTTAVSVNTRPLPTILESPVDIDILPGMTSKIGYALGWISTIMYASSRIPQIFRNWKRQSTEGLCVVLFCLAVLGNVSYSLQIFLTSLDPIYLIQSLPWIFGSLGVMTLDFIICLQFYCYKPVRRKHDDKEDASLLQSIESDAV